MASTGSVYPFMTVKDKKGRTQSIGRMKVSPSPMTFEARDFELNELRGIVMTPMSGFNRFDMVAGSIGSQSTKLYRRTFPVMYGSIGSVGSLNNYVKIKAYEVVTLGSITARAAGAQGTARLYIGTKAGSITAHYMAWGR